MTTVGARPPHVFTLTGNLLAERTLEFAAWTAGRTQRAVGESFQVGGKGINVSRMLNRLDVPNTALCFLGGASGADCEAWLRRREVPIRGFVNSRATRVGTVVRDRSAAHGETTFLGPDVPPDSEAVRACAEFLEAQADGQILAFCGSFPGWTEPTAAPLRAALERWNQRGLLVVDTYGPPLVDLARQPLALLKINADERRTLPAAPGFDALAAVKRWIVTDGPRQIHFRDVTGVEGDISPPPIHEVSPTGSGDVLLACVLEAVFVRQVSLCAAVEFAIPFAAANAAHPGVVEFDFPPIKAKEGSNGVGQR